MVKKSLKIGPMYSRFDIIPVCDGRTDRKMDIEQTDRHLAMA